MTTRKRFKRLVRARAAKTGESYATALRYFRDKNPPEEPMSQDEDSPMYTEAPAEVQLLREVPDHRQEGDCRAGRVHLR